MCEAGRLGARDVNPLRRCRVDLIYARCYTQGRRPRPGFSPELRRIPRCTREHATDRGSREPNRPSKDLERQGWSYISDAAEPRHRSQHCFPWWCSPIASTQHSPTARQNRRSNLSVDALAAAAHLSVRQFSRAVRQETGQSPAKAVEATADYSLWGSSAGARMAAAIGSHGTGRYGGSNHAA